MPGTFCVCLFIHQFQCEVFTFRCIPNSYKCDGDDDCRDGSDETDQLCGQSMCICFPFVCIWTTPYVDIALNSITMIVNLSFQSASF